MALYDDYFDGLQKSFSSLPRKLARKWLKTHEHPKCLYSLLRRLPEKSRVLDVGCGPGNLLELFNQYRDDVDYFGAEFYLPDSLAKKNNIHITKADFCKDIPFRENSFDLVVCYFVLEHIEINQLDIFCRNLASIVKPGGHLFLVFPNARSLHFGFYDDPTHIRPYTNYATSKLLAAKGIKDINSGIDRSWKILLLAPLYHLLMLFKKDHSNINFFAVHLFGINSYFLGRKRENAE